MRRATQIKDKTLGQTRQYMSGTLDKEGKPIPVVTKNQRLTKNQIIIFWSGSFIMLLASFVIGFKAGQKLGAKEVLDQAANQIVRLPIVRPIGRESETVSLAKLEPSSAKSDTLNSKDKELEERKIDFTSQTESSTVTKPRIIPKEELAPVKQPAIEISAKNQEIQKDNLEVYPGKDKFNAPGSAKKEEKKKVEAPIIVDPVKPTPEKPPFNVSSYKPTPGWYIQITAVPSLPEVENLHGKISSKNLPFKVESASIRNHPYYRILLGPYPDRATALEKRINAKTQTGTPGEPFIRQVK